MPRPDLPPAADAVDDAASLTDKQASGRSPVSAQTLHSAQTSVRSYAGEHQSHAHGHVQILYALQGRMELEVNGCAAFVDAASGMVIPAGFEHGYLAAPHTQVVVIDAPSGTGLDKARSFAVPALLRASPSSCNAAPSPQFSTSIGLPVLTAEQQLALVLQAPSLLSRRSLDTAQLQQQISACLHEDWPTERMASLCHLSVAQFHARFVELTGQTPQRWLRDLRLNAAVQLLARGMLLETCALHCGYNSASALAYALRRDRGLGSRALRKQGTEKS